MRLFIALNLPEPVRREIGEATEPLRARFSEIGWGAAERLHLTLKFIGEVEEERLENLRAAVVRAASASPAPLLQLHGVGAFPNFRKPRIVWVGVEEEVRLELLQHEVETACESAGYEVEGRPFRPHVTLGRVRGVLRDDRIREFRDAARRTMIETEAEVRTLDLMQSELAADGARHHCLLAAPMKGG